MFNPAAMKRQLSKPVVSRNTIDVKILIIKGFQVMWIILALENIIIDCESAKMLDLDMTALIQPLLSRWSRLDELPLTNRRHCTVSCRSPSFEYCLIVMTTACPRLIFHDPFICLRFLWIALSIHWQQHFDSSGCPVSYGLCSQFKDLSNFSKVLSPILGSHHCDLTRDGSALLVVGVKQV